MSDTPKTVKTVSPEDMVKVSVPEGKPSREERASLLDELEKLLRVPGGGQGGEAGGIGEHPAALAAPRWLAEGDDAEFQRSVEALLGWGHGSTPSGDDFLLGCSAALHAGGVRCEPRNRLLMRHVLQKAPEATTALSRDYLSYGARGEFHRIIAAMLVAFGHGLAPLFSARAKRVMALGHSSGRDFLTGFLYGGYAAQSILGNRGSKNRNDIVF